MQTKCLATTLAFSAERLNNYARAVFSSSSPVTSSGISGSKILGRNRDWSRSIGVGRIPRGSLASRPSRFLPGALGLDDEPPRAGKSSRRRSEFGTDGREEGRPLEGRPEFW